MTVILSVEDLRANYGGSVIALSGISLHVRRGEMVALLGANGAGKSTTLKAIANLLPAQRGQVTHGRIMLGGEEITRRSARRIVCAGLLSVLEGRHCFPSLTVEENLLTGAAAIGAGTTATRQALDHVYAVFPALISKRRLQAGLASGGEQQMVAVGRALMARPTMLVLDEPSMGLAPQIIEEIFTALTRLCRDEGVSMLVAEQNSTVALRSAGRAYVIENGEVVLNDSAAALRARTDMHALYLGLPSVPAQARQAQPAA